MNEQVRVIRVIEVPDIDQRGNVQHMMRVEFMVGDHGPFTQMMRKSEFSGGSMRAEIEAFAARLKDLTG